MFIKVMMPLKLTLWLTSVENFNTTACFLSSTSLWVQLNCSYDEAPGTTSGLPIDQLRMDDNNCCVSASLSEVLYNPLNIPDI